MGEPELTEMHFIHNQTNLLCTKSACQKLLPEPGQEQRQQCLSEYPALINTDRWSAQVEELTGPASDHSRLQDPWPLLHHRNETTAR